MGDSIAVDGRIDELRHVALCHHVEREHPAMRFPDLHLLARCDRLQPLADKRDCRLMSEPVAVMPEAVVLKTSRHR
jgi:hypothetical protein